MHIHKLQRLAYRLNENKIPFIPKMFYYIIFFLYNSSIPYTIKIGKNTRFAYGGIGVVIHGRAIIGQNCMIGQGITIGGRSKHKDVPIIGNSVYLGAGCRILGPIKIGDNVIIGPNAVVLENIPSNSIAVGIPAKVIKKGIKVEDYV
jgi:serine O-acetyltransferase